MRLTSVALILLSLTWNAAGCRSSGGDTADTTATGTAQPDDACGDVDAPCDGMATTCCDGLLCEGGTCIEEPSKSCVDAPCDGVATTCCDGHLCQGGTCIEEPSKSCWAYGVAASCNPVSDKACSATASCQLNTTGTLELACTGPAPTGALGDACDATTGCQPLLHCSRTPDSRCKRACCTNKDCPQDAPCHSFHGQLGTLGVCPIESE